MEWTLRVMTACERDERSLSVVVPTCARSKRDELAQLIERADGSPEGVEPSRYDVGGRPHLR